MSNVVDIAELVEQSVLGVVARGIGWAVLHSLWQGALVAIVTAIALGAMRRAGANARYLVACFGLLAVASSWTVTAVRAVDAAAAHAWMQAHDSAIATNSVSIVLGPAGPDDATPAIQPLPASATFGDGGDISWRARLEPWSLAIALVWLLGVGFLSARLAFGWAQVERLRRASVRTASDGLSLRAHHLAARLGIERTVRVARSAAVAVPTLIGWLRPVVILPVSVLAGLSPEQLDAILVHELAHVRRHDYLVNLCQAAVEILLFYHPACWWLSRRIRTERELCCDDIVVRVCRNPLAYARALADLEALREMPALALAATDGSLLRRVRRLLSPSDDGGGASGVAAVLAPVLIVMTLFGAHAADAGTQSVPVQESAPGISRIISADEGVIQGQVLDSASGKPVAGVTIEIGGMGMAVFPESDEGGRYEARGLKPGSYRVIASAAGYVTSHYGQVNEISIDFGAEVEVRGGTMTRGLDFHLREAASLNGRIADPQGRALAGVEVELVAERLLADGSRTTAVSFAQTNDAGTYRMAGIRPGDYRVRAYAGREMPKRKDGTAYMPTFYPDASTAATAQPLRLYAGQELFDVDITLGTSGLFRVSGRLVDPTQASVAGVRVRLRTMGVTSLETFSAASGVDGQFTIQDLAPGTYMVDIGDNTWQGAAKWLSAMQPIVVDRDVTGLELRAAAGTHIEGRIIRDGGATRRLNPSGTRAAFEIRRPGPEGGDWMSRIGCRAATADGRFTCDSPGGPAMFVLETVPDGWMVKAVHVDGAPAGDEPRDFGGAATREIEVVLTDRVNEIAGLVVDRNGRTLSNYAVVLFPADRSRWHPQSRYVMQAQSSNEGRFRIAAIPPGEYLSVAVPGLPPRAAYNPDVLTHLAAIGSPIRVSEGEERAISIRASPMPDGLIAAFR